MNKGALWIMTVHVKQAPSSASKCESILLLFILGHAVQDKRPVSSKQEQSL